MASAAGYMSVRGVAQEMVNAGATADQVLARIPVVHVAAESQATTTVTLVRGATVSGRVQWEDGSPAAGIQMTVVPVTKPVAMPAQLQTLRGGQGAAFSSVTDDRGAFRLLGLASGDYYVQAMVDPRAPFVQGGGFGVSQIKVYAPGVFRMAAAKTVTVREGDERDDLRMVLDLTALHTVSGHVSAPSAGQNIASGTVSVVDTSDNTVQASGSIGANGDFAIQYVSAGNYTLSVSGASTQATPTQGFRGRGQQAAAMFQVLQQPLQVGDTDASGVNVALTAANTASSQ
jgi:hypothetical protein